MSKQDIVGMLILLPFILAIIYVGMLIDGF